MNSFINYEKLIEQAPDAIIFSDSKGDIRMWNPKAEELFGYSSEEALGKSLNLVIPERLRDAHWKGFYKSIETGITKYQGKTLLTKSIRKDGGTLYLNMTFGIVKSNSGEVIGVQAFIRDYTEQYQAEKNKKE